MDRRKWVEGCLRPKGNKTLEDIVGLDAVAEELKEALFSPNARGTVLLYGPPGVGKTLLIEALQNFSPVPLLRIPVPELVCASPDISTSLQFLTDYIQPHTVVVLDELDIIGGEHSVESVKQFLELRVAQGRVIVAVTAYPWRLPQVLLRRFEKRVFIDLPNAQARAALIASHFPTRLSDGDLAELVNMSAGLSYADLICVVREAQMKPLREILRTGYYSQYYDGEMRYIIPSDSSTHGALPISDLSVNSRNAQFPPISLVPFTQTQYKSALTSTQPSVRDMDSFRRFREEYG